MPVLTSLPDPRDPTTPPKLSEEKEKREKGEAKATFWFAVAIAIIVAILAIGALVGTFLLTAAPR